MSNKLLVLKPGFLGSFSYKSQFPRLLFLYILSIRSILYSIDIFHSCPTFLLNTANKRSLCSVHLQSLLQQHVVNINSRNYIIRLKRFLFEDVALEFKIFSSLGKFPISNPFNPRPLLLLKKDVCRTARYCK